MAKLDYSWNRGFFSILRTLMHLIAAVHFWYGIYYFTFKVNIPETTHRMGNSFGGKFKYLTYLDAIVQAIYFTICLVNDFIGTNDIQPKKTPTIRKVKDYLLAAFAFPLATNVGLTFWSLMAIDRELIFPKAFDDFFPGWLNHVLHTNIVVFIILEMCTSFRKYPSRKSGMTGLLIFMAAYLGWIHVIKHYSGVWVYPVLDVLDVPQRIVFFAVSCFISVGLYLVGEFINNQIWTKEIRQLKGNNKNKSK